MITELASSPSDLSPAIADSTRETLQQRHDARILPCRGTSKLKLMFSLQSLRACGLRPGERNQCKDTFAKSSAPQRQIQCKSQEDSTEGWIAQNQSLVRASPLVAGGLGVFSVVLNRSVAGAVGLDASSAASRTDVIIIALSATLLLTGLQWIALRPVEKEAVILDGREVSYSHRSMPVKASKELEWAWTSLEAATRCKSLVVFKQGVCIFHRGMANEEADPAKSSLGPICQKAREDEKGNYLANLGLYPGRFEFTAFLPRNTQGVIVRPLGKQGVMIAATDTQRGFGKLDQAWISLIADKVDSTLESFSPSGKGFKVAAAR